MIPHVTKRLTTTTGSIASAQYGISADNVEHIMAILRDGLYTDAILAILREYAANGWDAHRLVGKHAVPIKITLPTRYESTLRIRDYGPGLSLDDVLSVYTQYGASTKRTSNDEVGCLGIGSKSGFAYADSFTITSWHDGVVRVFVAVKFETDEGNESCRVDLLSELPCDPTETGIEIQIATKAGDHYDFERTARRLYKHMTPRPDINIELPALPDERTVLTHGVISPGAGEWVAVMGCIPYRVNLAQLDAKLISPALAHMSGELTFPIGGVTMSANREELKYSNVTRTALIQKANDLVDEFVTQALKTLESGSLDGWQTRLQIQVLAKLDLPLPDKWKPFAEGFAKVVYQPGDFTITHNKGACTRLAIDVNTRLLIDDTGNELSGYSLSADDYVVRSPSKTPAELRVALDAALVTSGLTGVKIGLLSTLYWTAPVVPQKRKSNPKHRARMFQLTSAHKGKAPWSENWEPVTRIPTADDVYIVIENFKPCEGHLGANDYKDFWSEYAEDQRLTQGFGEALPTVYAYKTTEKKPLTATPDGTHYREWRKTLAAGLLTPERITLIGAYWRAHPESGRYHDNQTPGTSGLKYLTKQLGEDHPIIAFYLSAADANKAIVERQKAAIKALATRNDLGFNKSAAHLALSLLKKRYPLLSRAGWRNLWDEGYGDDKHARDEWIEYVQLRDARDAPARDNVVQLTSVP